ncbi:MAG: DUF3048 domain-containing protein [Patescibacteria group bacterium]|nr:DUF3048 domain-containing protein [Patescibacteria group bacterium]
MSKIKEFKIRVQVWWENLGENARYLVMGLGGALGLVVVAAVLYAGVSFLRGQGYKFISPLDSRKSSEEDVHRPFAEGDRTEPAPINGVLYTKAAADIFMNRRPLAIMINNHPDARPQFGLSKADLIYEAVAEGGITRLLAFFHAWDVDKIGPVRSARVYYEDWAAEFNSWYAHWGGAYMDADDKANQNNLNYDFTCHPQADSYAKINRINLPSLDQMWLGTTAYWRDNGRGVASEHTGYTSTLKLWQEAPNRYPGWEGYEKFEQWEFKDDNPAQAPTASQVEFNFWDIPSFAVRWEYIPEENAYRRYQGGELQVDAGTDNAPLTAKNIILQFTRETSFNDQKKHLNYETVGSGNARVFLDGREIQATWEKGAIRERTKFYDEQGNELEFNRGQIWVEVVPMRNMGNVKVS